MSPFVSCSSIKDIQIQCYMSTYQHGGMTYNNPYMCRVVKFGVGDPSASQSKIDQESAADKKKTEEATKTLNEKDAALKIASDARIKARKDRNAKAEQARIDQEKADEEEDKQLQLAEEERSVKDMQAISDAAHADKQKILTQRTHHIVELMREMYKVYTKIQEAKTVTETNDKAMKLMWSQLNTAHKTMLKEHGATHDQLLNRVSTSEHLTKGGELSESDVMLFHWTEQLQSKGETVPVPEILSGDQEKLIKKNHTVYLDGLKDSRRLHDGVKGVLAQTRNDQRANDYRAALTKGVKKETTSVKSSVTPTNPYML